MNHRVVKSETAEALEQKSKFKLKKHLFSKKRFGLLPTVWIKTKELRMSFLPKSTITEYDDESWGIPSCRTAGNGLLHSGCRKCFGRVSFVGPNFENSENEVDSVAKPATPELGRNAASQRNDSGTNAGLAWGEHKLLTIKLCLTIYITYCIDIRYKSKHNEIKITWWLVQCLLN